ncbi:GAS8-like protein, putative [Hepatocystis sp. ex Piliocolobus tephrosceles]|nr:GAS8-like protein, putative [Hepatocystis sp. ex Piliocolobus tephrosceles]
MNKKKTVGKKKINPLKARNNELKKLTNAEIKNLVQTKKEELIRTVQKKHLLEKKLEDKYGELESFKKDYSEIKNKIDLISGESERYNLKSKNETIAIKHKSVFYSFQNEEQVKKLEKEKENLKILIDEKHEHTMNVLMNWLEQQRINLDNIKNKNFEEINKLSTLFNSKIKNLEELFTKELEQYNSEQKEEMEEMVENYNIIQRNEINYLKNLYNDYINNVNTIHTEVLQNYKKYYIDQIKENISKIKLLKQKINEIESNDKEIKKELNIHNDKNSSILENINKLEIKRENIVKELKFYSKDFLLYKNLELIYNESELYIKNLKQFSQRCTEKIVKIEKSLKDVSEVKDNKFDYYFENIKNKNIALKKEAANLDYNLESLNNELKEYINKQNITKENQQAVQKGIDFCVNNYYNEFDHLIYTKRKIKKKINDTINIYEKRIKDVNIKKSS